MADRLRQLYHRPRYDWCEYFQLKIEFSGKNTARNGRAIIRTSVGNSSLQQSVNCSAARQIDRDAQLVICET